MKKSYVGNLSYVAKSTSPNYCSVEEFLVWTINWYKFAQMLKLLFSALQFDNLPVFVEHKD